MEIPPDISEFPCCLMYHMANVVYQCTEGGGYVLLTAIRTMPSTSLIPKSSGTCFRSFLCQFGSLYHSPFTFTRAKAGSLLHVLRSFSMRIIADSRYSLVTAVAQGQQDSRAIQDLIGSSERSSKQHISNEFQKQQIALVANEHRRALLESLHFPEMHLRQENIKDNHKNTFEWIFDNSGDQLRPGTNFMEWLEVGHGTYWISGKAGSGKSTLMNMICQDERIKPALKAWAGSRELLVPTCFFWNAGTELQKSCTGLLRSLLYNILAAQPDVSPAFLDTLAGSECLSHHPTSTIWSERALRETLLRVVQSSAPSFALCIFIDGLDEFTGDQVALIALVDQLTRCSNVKACLSSRPYLRFEGQFGSTAMLRLQDLTENHIQQYVSSRLSTATNQRSDSSESQIWLKAIVSRIVERAQGVFLWVDLAVSDQIEGVYNGDSQRLLEQRLDAFPRELEEVYKSMLQRIDPIYQEECVVYFQMVLQFPTLYLSELALATYDNVDDFVRLFPNQEAIDFTEICDTTKRRITTTCKDFLEVKHVPNDMMEKSFQPTVTFVHRSAADFMQNHDAGRSFLETNICTTENAQERYVKARLARMILKDCSCGLGDADTNLVFHAASVLTDLADLERLGGEAREDLTDLVDKILSTPGHWLDPTSTSVPWSLLDCKVIIEHDVASSEIRLPIEPDVGLPTDFLVEAARHDLRLYVLEKLDKIETSIIPHTASHLLACLFDRRRTGGLGFGGPWTPLETMSALLRRGASAGKKVGKKSSWALFLEDLYSSLPLASTGLQSTFVDLILLFLQRTPDANCILSPQHSVGLDVRMDGLGQLPGNLYTCLELSMKPVTAIRHTLWGDPELSRIERAFAAYPGFDPTALAVVTKIYPQGNRRGFNPLNVVTFSRWFEQGDTDSSLSSARQLDYPEYELSGEQSHRLSRAFEAFMTEEEWSDRERACESLQREVELTLGELYEEEYMRKLEEYMRKLPEQREDFQEDSQSSSTDESSSDNASFHSANS